MGFTVTVPVSVNSALHRVDDVVLDVTDREVFGLETCNSLLGVFLLVAQA